MRNIPVFFRFSTPLPLTVRFPELAILFAVVLFSLPISPVCATSYCISKAESAKIRATELGIYASQGYVVARLLQQEKLNHQKILILVDKEYEGAVRFQSLIQMLLDCGIPQANLVFDPVLAPSPLSGPDGQRMNPSMPMRMRMTAEDFDRAVQRHSDCTVVITLFGIPLKDGREISFLRKAYDPAAPQLIMMGAITDHDLIRDGLQNGNIFAVVIPREDANYEVTELPLTQEEIFRLRYRLITKANAAELQ